MKALPAPTCFHLQQLCLHINNTDEETRNKESSSTAQKVIEEGGGGEERPHLCCEKHKASVFSGNRPTLANADIKDTLAAYFKTKERWIYKAG